MSLDITLAWTLLSFLTVPSSLRVPCVGNKANEYAQQLQRAYPGLKVNGEPMNPPPLHMYAAQMLSFVFIGGIALQFIGGMVLPKAWNDFMSENRFMFIGLIYMCQIAAGQLIATGAFEVELTDNSGTHLIYSKLETKQIPSMPLLMDLLTNKYGLPAPN